jgi:small subunit ribosomal protein S9
MITHKPKTEEKKERYFEATGGRKTAIARARIWGRGSGVTVNDKDIKEYFKAPRNQSTAKQAFDLLKLDDGVRATVRVSGGGIYAQAEAVRNAIAKALIKFDVEFKKRLRRAGFVTRDARMVERKKYGFKKARRAPQWQKR